MHNTVTVGMIVWPLVAIAGFAIVVGGFLLILSFFADAFKD